MTPPKAFEILGLDINTVQHDDVHTAYAKKVAEADGPFKALTLRKLEHARNQALKKCPARPSLQCLLHEGLRLTHRRDRR